MYTLLRSLWVLIINQTVKALAEAEAYPGPSLIIAYAPCINHGIKKGMSKAQTEEELAVEAGYWHLLPLTIRLLKASKLHSGFQGSDRRSDQDFLNGEVRYNSLKRANPERAEKLFAKNAECNKERYEYLNRLITLYGKQD